MFPFPEDPTPARPNHRTVDRIAAILEFVAREREPQSLTKIAQAVGAPVSSVQSLVNGLTATGYLKEEGKTYRLGLAPYFLTALAGQQLVTTVTHEMLEDIVAETGFIVVLAVLIGEDVYYVDYACSDPAFEYLAQNRLKRHPLETSAGWVLLSGLDVPTAWNYLAAAEGKQELVDRFQREYPTLRQTGECVAPGVASNGADGVAVAVRDRSADRSAGKGASKSAGTGAGASIEGTAVAAVSVIATTEEISANSEHIIGVLRKHAHRWNS